MSLGVDTFHNDPISDLAVSTEGFREQGELVAQLALPTVVLQEGGYDVAAIGDNVRAFLLGCRSGLTRVADQSRPSAVSHSVATSSDSRNSMSVSVFQPSRSSVVIIALSSLMSAASWSP